MRPSLALIVQLGAMLSACVMPTKVRPSAYWDALPATTVCRLAGIRTQPHGIDVRIRAINVTDYMERDIITDSKCPTVEIAFFLDHLATREDADRYDQLIIKNGMLDSINGHGTGVYSIDAAGRFIYREKERPHAVLYIDKIWGVERLPCTAFYSQTQCEPSQK